MNFITEKVNDGVIDLSQLSLSKLLELVSVANEEDKNTLGHEIIYRNREEWEEIKLETNRISSDD